MENVPENEFIIVFVRAFVSHSATDHGKRKQNLCAHAPSHMKIAAANPTPSTAENRTMNTAKLTATTIVAHSAHHVTIALPRTEAR